VHLPGIGGGLMESVGLKSPEKRLQGAIRTLLHPGEVGRAVRSLEVVSQFADRPQSAARLVELVEVGIDTP